MANDIASCRAAPAASHSNVGSCKYLTRGARRGTGGKGTRETTLTREIARMVKSSGGCLSPAICDRPSWILEAVEK